MKYYLTTGAQGVRIHCGSEPPRYNSNGGRWEADAINVAALPGEYHVGVEPDDEVGNLTPTPPEFLLLLTLSERAAIRAATATDPVVADLLSMINDSRLTYVDLANVSVQEAVLYMTGKPALLTKDRAERVLSGLPPKAAA